MEERTKQRLVGVLVFVGALFIVLPFLFHNAHPNANTSASNGQKTADANSAVTVSMPAENNTAPASKPQTVAINDNNAAPSPDQNAPAAMPDAALPAPQSATASDAAGPAPQAPTTPGAAAVPPAPATPSTPAQPTNAPVAMPASAATTAGGDAAVPSNNPTKFPSMAPSDAGAPTTPPSSTSSSSSSPVTIPATPANNGVDASPAATTNHQQNTSLNKKPAVTADAAPSIEEKPMVAVSAPETALAKADIKKPVLHHVTAESAAIAEGWTVQLGAFSDRSNATHLMATLREHHFHVYSRQVAHGEHPLTVVFVGPERSLDHARFAQQHLRSEFKLSGEIKRYEA